jgi:hypothetical protein
VIILRKMRWVGCVAHIVDELQISVENLKGKGNLGEDERMILK